MKSTRGVIITQVDNNSPAQKAGLQVYDIIVGIDKFRINDENTLIGLLQQEFRSGDTIELKIIRDNRQITRTMKLEKR